VVLCLFLLVFVEEVLNFIFQLVLLLIEIAYYSVILLLLVIIDSLHIGILLSESSELLDLRGEFLLLVLDFILNLGYNACNLLQCLVFLVVKDFVCL
jgi:hypothetical protein